MNPEIDPQSTPPAVAASLEESVEAGVARSSPEMFAWLKEIGVLGRLVSVALEVTARDLKDSDADPLAIAERAAGLIAGRRDARLRALMDTAAAFPDDPAKWHHENPEIDPASLEEGVEAAVARSSPEMFAWLKETGVLGRLVSMALEETTRDLEDSGADPLTIAERAARLIAERGNARMRALVDTAGAFSDDPAKWHDEILQHKRQTAPEGARAMEQSPDLDFHLGAVAALGRRTLAQTPPEGPEGVRDTVPAKLAMMDASAKYIEGPRTIAARADAFKVISFLEFDRLATWLQWGDGGSQAEFLIERVMQAVAQEPALGKLLDHPAFRSRSDDGDVLLELLLGARAFGEGRVEEALERFTRANGPRPSAFIVFRIANCMRTLDRKREALALLEGALAQWPGEVRLTTIAAAVAFALGDADRANRIFAPHHEAYFTRYQGNRLIAERQRELDESMAEGRLYREQKSDIYDDVFAETTWWNYWYHFNAFTRHQHAEGILGEVAPEYLEAFLRSGRVKARTCVEVGTMCGELLHRVALRNPDTRFYGVDRNPVIKRLNDRIYELPNLEFRADDIVKFLEEDHDFEGAVLFHTRTSPFLLPDFLRKMYALCRSRGFGAVCMLEVLPLSIRHRRFQGFEQMPEVSEVRGGGLLHHNYPLILKEAGFGNIEYEFVPPATLLAGIDTSIFLRATAS